MVILWEEMSNKDDFTIKKWWFHHQTCDFVTERLHFNETTMEFTSKWFDPQDSTMKRGDLKKAKTQATLKLKFELENII